MKNYDFFVKHIEPIYLCYLRDRASAIRGMGVKMISSLIKAFGDSWINSMMGKLEEVLLKESSYHFKIAAIYSLKEVCLSPLGESYL